MHIVQPRTFNPRKTLFVGAIILLLIIVTLNRRPPEPPDFDAHWRGETMGTYYDIKIADFPVAETELEAIRASVDAYLIEMNRQMSTYIADSEISQFNRSQDIEVPFPVSQPFASITQSALAWAERSGGTFDPTLDPLINFWGFGHTARQPTDVDENELHELRDQVGFKRIQVVDGTSLQKSRADVQLNLNAIAKGAAVDGVAALLKEHGATNIYVELGGDMVVSGLNAQGIPWRIAVESPAGVTAPDQRIYGIMNLTRGAVAGSGDYRQFQVDADGQRMSHIIDPRTGRPVDHDVAAVHVWAPLCMDADAVATAAMVMGEDEGLRWIESLPDIEAIFFIRQADETYRTVKSSRFVERTGFRRR